MRLTPLAVTGNRKHVKRLGLCWVRLCMERQTVFAATESCTHVEVRWAAGKVLVRVGSGLNASPAWLLQRI
jgi:hypothetical protein